MNNIKLRNFDISNSSKLTLMGGMNVLESRDLAKSLDSRTFMPPIRVSLDEFEISKFLSFILFISLLYS